MDSTLPNPPPAPTNLTTPPPSLKNNRYLILLFILTPMWLILIGILLFRPASPSRSPDAHRDIGGPSPTPKLSESNDTTIRSPSPNGGFLLVDTGTYITRGCTLTTKTGNLIAEFTCANYWWLPNSSGLIATVFDMNLKNLALVGEAGKSVIYYPTNGQPPITLSQSTSTSESEGVDFTDEQHFVYKILTFSRPYTAQTTTTEYFNLYESAAIKYFSLNLATLTSTPLPHFTPTISL
jgi:hypothetical protein